MSGLESQAAVIEVVANGRPQRLPEGTTIAAWLDRIGQPAGRVAVEVNRELVPKARFAATVLKAGDRVEIVTLVGGG